jgi:hypothetical protein
MGAHKRTPRKAKVIAGLASSALVAGGLVAVSGLGAASADTSELTLTYACPFPLIGSDEVVVTINADIPPVLGVGEPSGPISIDTVSVVGERATQGLNLVGAKTLTGTGVSFTHISGPGTELPLQVPVTLEDTPIPASGTFSVNAAGSAPSISFDQPGDVAVMVNELTLTLTPLDANGEETGLGTFDSDCTLNPADQDNVLFQGEVVADPTDPDPTDPTDPDPTDPDPTDPDPTDPDPTDPDPTDPDPTDPDPTDPDPTDPDPTDPDPTDPDPTDPDPTDPDPTDPDPTDPDPTDPTDPEPVHYSFDLAGESYIGGPNGTVPLSGDLNARFDLASGDYTADLNLEPTSGSFRLLGFLPATVQIAFDQVGETTGTLTNGQLQTHSEMYVHLPSVKIFGLPVGGGSECRTSSPSVVELQSTGDFFNPLDGGQVSGDYDLAKLEGCGFLGPIISIFTAGPDNTIDLDLIPTT